MNGHDLDTLIETANREVECRRRRISGAVKLTALIYSSTFAIIISASAYFHAWRLMTITCALCAIPAAIALYTALSNTFKQTILELAGCNDVRAIPALSEAAYYGNGSLQATAQNALVRLLYQVTEHDRNVFSTEVFATQRRLFSRSRELQLALLHAYQAVGGSNEMQTAQWIIRKRRTTDPGLTAAAERCVAAIRAHISRANDLDMLLRTTQTPNTVNLLHTTDGQTSDEAATSHEDAGLVNGAATGVCGTTEASSNQQRLTR